ncbi:MAG: hypothetical protein ACP5NL_05605 [Thermoplasmata archaeon]
MKITKGIGSFIVSLFMYVIIPYLFYSTLDGSFSRGSAIVREIPIHIKFISGITVFNIISIGLFIAIFAFLRVSSESRKWKVIFSILQMESVLAYILYFYLYGWLSMSISGFSFYSNYGGIFLIFAVMAIARFARIITDAVTMKGINSASIS